MKIGPLICLALLLLGGREALAACSNTITIADALTAQHPVCRGADASSNYITEVALIDQTGAAVGTSGNPLFATITNSTIAVTQSGTWTVQPGNIANTTAWLVTGAGGSFPATQSGNWSVRLQDALGNGINSTSSALNVNLSGSSVTVTVAGSGTFTTSDTHFPATQALSDAISNPTVSGMAGYNMLWDATNSVWRRAQTQAGTGAMQVDVVAGAVGGTNSNYAAAFPTAGTAIGFKDGSGNMQPGKVDANGNINIDCGGQPCNLTDNSGFTPGTTGYANVGGFFQTTATNNACTNLNGCAAQITANRALFVNLRDSTGTELNDTTNHTELTEAFIGGNSNLPLQPRVCQSYAFVTPTTATNTQIVALVAAKTIRICDVEAFANGSDNWYLESATAASCGGTLAQLTTTRYFVTNQGEKGMKSLYNGLNAGSGNALCVNTSAAATISIGVWYDQST